MSTRSSHGVTLSSDHALWSTVSVMIIIVFVCLLTRPATGGAAGALWHDIPGETLEGRVLQVQDESAPAGLAGWAQRHGIGGSAGMPDETPASHLYPSGRLCGGRAPPSPPPTVP
jgi:hypothetical protein